MKSACISPFIRSERGGAFLSTLAPPCGTDLVTGASCLTVPVAEGVGGVALTCCIARQVSSIEVPADARTGGKRFSATFSTVVPLLVFLGGGGVVFAGGYAVAVSVGGNVITVRGDGSIIGISGPIVY